MALVEGLTRKEAGVDDELDKRQKSSGKPSLGVAGWAGLLIFTSSVIGWGVEHIDFSGSDYVQTDQAKQVCNYVDKCVRSVEDCMKKNGPVALMLVACFMEYSKGYRPPTQPGTSASGGSP